MIDLGPEPVAESPKPAAGVERGYPADLLRWISPRWS